MKPDDVVREAAERYGMPDNEEVRVAFSSSIARLVLAGGIRLHSQGPSWIATPSERPMASRLARHQARTMGWLTNQRHEPVRTDPVWRVLLQYLDGRHDRAMLVEQLAAQVRKGELTLQHEGRPVTDPDEILKRVANSVEAALARLAENALLVA